VRSCEICFIVSDSPNPPLDWDQLGHAEFATRSPVRFTFSGTQRGMWLHIAARWVSTRGEKGPWCEIISLVIA
jgi:hypothetical protein